MVAGPVAIGACMLLGRAPDAGSALSLPAVWIGVLFVMLPTLYIGAAILGIAPSAADLGRAATNSLERSSIALLGLAPALAFLIGTSVEAFTADVLAKAVLVVGALIGLGSFYRGVFTDYSTRVRGFVLFAAWAVIAMAIGTHLFGAIAGAS